MFYNYFKIAIRILARNKVYSFINIAGLAVGLAACILILLYIKYELSYDRYNKSADKIYRVAQHISTPDHESDFAASPASLASLLKTNSPDVKNVARIVQMSHHISTYTDVLVSYKSNHFYEKNLYYADPSAFQIFTWPVLKGDVQTGLSRPYTIFISSSMAQKYFDKQSPVGKSLQIGGEDYEVTGVFKDFSPNSHIHPDFLASFSTIDPSTAKNMSVYIYLLLKNKSDLPEVTKQLSKIAKNAFPSSQNEHTTFSLMPLLNIHLHSDLRLEAEPQGDIRYVYLFGAIALLILVIACFNYVNMAVAQSSKRGLETGIRKVAGATRNQLISQYFFESFLLNLFALIIAMCLVEWTLPYFNHLTQLNLSLWSIDPLWLIALLPGVLIIISFLSGSYPALLLSSFRPSLILKGKAAFGSGTQLRKWLVVFQFIISIVLIVCAIIIQMQMNFIQKEKPSVKNSSILLIKNRGESLSENYSAFKSQLLANSQVKYVSTTQFVPGFTKETTGFGPNDIEGYHEKISHIPVFYGDEDFIKTFGLDVLKGRNFSKNYSSDREKSVLVNEKAVKTFGWKDPVGKYIWFKTGHLSNGKLIVSREKKYVIGVVKNFHYESLRKEVEPVIIKLTDNTMVNIAIQISNNNIPQTLSFIKKKWSSFVPDKPLDYSFLQDDYSVMYQKDRLLNRLFKNFAFLAIIISCLGLFGLSSFTVKQRTKEIGIRKVLGASTSQIITLLSKNFLKLVIVAIIIAIPGAWLAMNVWLQNFAYQITIHWWIFLLAGVLSIFIAWLTVSFQTIRAARGNPSEALKYE